MIKYNNFIFWLIIFTLIFSLIYCMYLGWNFIRKKSQGFLRNIGWIGVLLSKYGYTSNIDVVNSFQQAISVIQDELKCSVKDIPFYLLIGSNQSGKSTMINNINLKKIGNLKSSDDNSFLSWGIYDQGVVMNIRGKAFINSEDFYEFSLLLSLLKNIRNNNPIDGIILTESIDEVTKKDQIVIATNIREKLKFIQQSIKMKLPVYLLITKCDLIYGFNEFCSAIPEIKKQNILGWSNPNQIDVLYKENVINSAFDLLKENLIKIKHEISIKKIEKNQKLIFLFVNKILSLQNNISKYVNTLFINNVGSTSCFFRGIYFIGDQNQKSQFTDKNYCINDDKKIESNNLCFINDLFVSKIFVEKNLAIPTDQFFIQNSFTNKTYGMIIVCLFSFLCFQTKNELNTTFYKARNNISTLRHVAENIKVIRAHNSSISSNLLNVEIINTIHSLNNLQKLSTYKIPLSWLSNTDKNLDIITQKIYTNYIFKFIEQDLVIIQQDKINKYSAINVENNKSINNNLYTYHSFKVLNNYVNEMYALQAAMLKWNNIKHTQNINDLNDILYFLYKVKNVIADQKKTLFVSIINESIIQIININEKKEVARKTFTRLYKTFLKNALSLKHINGLDHFKKHTDALFEDNDINIYELLYSITGIIESVNHPNNYWMHNKNFNLGETFNNMISKSAGLLFVDSEYLSSILQYSETEFGFFKKNIARFSSDVIKNIFFVNSVTGVIEISNDFMVLMGELNLISSQLSINKASQSALPSIDSSTSIIFFDVKNLNVFLDEITKYNINVYSKNESVNKITKSAINNFTKSTIVESSKIVSIDTFFINMSDKEKLELIIENVKATSNVVLNIIKNGKYILSKKTYDQIIKLFIANYTNVLLLIEKAIYELNLYKINHYDFYSWDKKTPISLYAFNKHNTLELDTFLMKERERLFNLVNANAEIVLNILTEIYQGSGHDNAIYIKWMEIMNNIKNYSNTNQNDAIVLIEKLLVYLSNNDTSFNEVNELLNNYTKINQHDMVNHNILSFVKKIKKTFTKIREDNFKKDYKEIKFFFNANIAGKYPFIRKSDTTEEEVSYSTIYTFLTMLKRKQEIFDVLSDSSIIEIDASTKLFLFQIKAFVDMFDIVNDKIIFNSNLILRANKKAERQLKYINQFIIKSGDENYILLNNNNNNLIFEWKPGDKISIILKYSNESNVIPYTKGSKSNDNIYKFRYNGLWAIFRFFNNHVVFNDLLKFEVNNINKVTKKKLLSTKIFASMNKSTQVVNLPVYAP